MNDTQSELDAVVLVKAAPYLDKELGEIVSCIAVTADGGWVRLHLKGRAVEQSDKLRRWTKIRFAWQKSLSDARSESCDVDAPVQLLGEISESERHLLLEKMEVTDLQAVQNTGGTLALLRPKNLYFFVERKDKSELEEEQNFYESALKNQKLPGILEINKPCSYRFKYKYHVNGKEYQGTCEDWGIHGAFSRLSQTMGEANALVRMLYVLGKEYPKKDVIFVMSTGLSAPDQWLINGIIISDEVYHYAYGNRIDMVA